MVTMVYCRRVVCCRRMWACLRDNLAELVMSAVSVVSMPKNLEGAGMGSSEWVVSSCSPSSARAVAVLSASANS